ncbi:MAG TPA: TVP38/TMEM64 family protein [Spirochaetia bacterium]|nr:TVP38/TMEM64 family protein [Spirochaetia bacterium]
MAGKSTTKVVLLLVAAAALITAGILFDVNTYLRSLLDWVREQGVLGVIVFAGVYITATVFFIPGSILTLGAGFVYGVVWGTLYVSVASTIGATAAFLVGRYLARDWVASKVAGNERFSSIDAAVGNEGWKIVGLTRLSPIFPFNLLNYAYGLTKVSLRDYFFASWIGMFPGTVMYVYIGSLAGSLASVGAEERVRTTGEWVLYGVGLAATVIVTLYVTRLARKALSRKIDVEPVVGNASADAE